MPLSGQGAPCFMANGKQQAGLACTSRTTGRGNSSSSWKKAKIGKRFTNLGGTRPRGKNLTLVSAAFLKLTGETPKELLVFLCAGTGPGSRSSFTLWIAPKARPKLGWAPGHYLGKDGSAANNWNGIKNKSDWVADMHAGRVPFILREVLSQIADSSLHADWLVSSTKGFPLVLEAELFPPQL